MSCDCDSFSTSSTTALSICKFSCFTATGRTFFVCTEMSFFVFASMINDILYRSCCVGSGVGYTVRDEIAEMNRQIRDLSSRFNDLQRKCMTILFARGSMVITKAIIMTGRTRRDKRQQVKLCMHNHHPQLNQLNPIHHNHHKDQETWKF